MISRLLPLAAAFCLSSAPLLADTLRVTEAWSPPTLKGSPNGVAFLTLENTGEADALKGVAAPVSDTAQLHTHDRESDIMRMRRVESFPIPTEGSLQLAPGHDHIMLIGIHKPLTEGDRFPLTLTFEHHAPLTVQVEVRPAPHTSHTGH